MLTTDEIRELALAPKRTTTDEGTVEERDIKDIVAAQQLIANVPPETVPWGIRIARTAPRGTVTPIG